MTTDPVEAEALGQTHITATYQGYDFAIPADADLWPLNLIHDSVGVHPDRGLIADHATVAAALQTILGDQWEGFLAAFPLARDLVPASREFAKAIGFEPRPVDLAFGPLPVLIATIRRYRDAIEATLGALGLDYRDRWRFDAAGRRLLTLRGIHVRLVYAPLESPLFIAQNGGKIPHNQMALILMDIWETLNGYRMPHPSRPMSAEQREERKPAEDKTRDLIADYHRRHQSSPKLSPIKSAQANARLRKDRSHAQSTQDS